MTGLVFCFLGLHGYLYKDNKWESYSLEFKSESKSERRKGSILVFGYLIISILPPFILPVICHNFFK